MLSIATFVLHLATAGSYGYQRDELYFISCAQHLAWGYVDQPPLIAVIAKLALVLFGDSLYGIRLLPGLAAAALVFLTGRLTRSFGGGLWAQGVAMIGVALAPFCLAVGSLLTMNAFEPLLWLGSAYLFTRALASDDARLWAAFGAVAGLALIDKYSAFFFFGSSIAGIALSPQRRALRRPGFYGAIALALLIVAPTLVWQSAHGWPQLELLRNAAAGKNIDENAFVFYTQQLLMMGPLAAPVWLAGLFALFRSPQMQTWRWYALAYVTLSIAYALLHAKVYYLAPIYPALFAAGAAFAEARVASIAPVRFAYPALLVAMGLAIAPEAFPLLPLPAFIAYEHLLDVRSVKMEKHPEGLVPQHFADMLGWNSLVDTLGNAYDALPPSERRDAVILTRDYGQASAVDFLGPKRGLPEAISGHNNYFLYGTRGHSGSVVLAVGVSERLLDEEYADVRQVATYSDPYVLPDVNDLPVYACTHPRQPLAAWWPHLKRYI